MWSWPALYHSNHMLFTICSFNRMADYLNSKTWWADALEISVRLTRLIRWEGVSSSLHRWPFLPLKLTGKTFWGESVDAPICCNLCPLWVRLKMLCPIPLQGPELNPCFGCSFPCLPSHLAQSHQMNKMTRTPHISESHPHFLNEEHCHIPRKLLICC